MEKMKVSLICACKNRNQALNLSLASWLNFEQITEIIIVDWSSDKPLDYLTDLDERIKIVRVNDQKHFNQPQPLNLAISLTTGDHILKADCDHVINPYYNFFDTYQIDDTSFVSGKNSYKSPEKYSEELGAYVIDRDAMTDTDLVDYYNTYSPYYKYLIGLLYVTKENFLKVGGYNEALGQYYAYEDDELYQRLELLNLNHKRMNFDHRFFHVPHPDKKRIENFVGYEDPKFIDNVRSNLSPYYSGQELDWQVDYAISMHHIKCNEEIISKVTEAYVKPKTEWDIVEVRDRYYIANIKEPGSKNKLDKFPSVNFISVDYSTERREKLFEQFANYGIKNLTPHIFEKYEDSKHTIVSEYLERIGDWRLSQGSRGPVTSHLKAVKEWLNSTTEDYAFFCEDDLSLETVKYWNFTWEEFFNKLPLDWDCIQLSWIRENFSIFHIGFRSRCWCDWSACAYLITRKYAQKLIDTYHYDDAFYLDTKAFDAHVREDWAVVPVVETIMFSLTDKVYGIPLFVEDISLMPSYEKEYDESSEHIGHLDQNHTNSHNIVVNWWKDTASKMKINELIVSKDKLIDFPSVYYISLEESQDRRDNLQNQFHEYGIYTFNPIISKRFHESDDKVYGEQLHILDDGTTGCVVSHIKAIRKWYEETDEDYAFFCEDDLSLDTVKYWTFNWTDFIEALPEDAECIQLCCVRSNQEEVTFRERTMYDWSVTAYILTRDYARKIIERYCDGDSYRLEIPGTQFYPMPETVLFYGLGKVYAFDLFVEDQNLKSTFTETANIEGGNKEHHIESYEHVLNWWRNIGSTSSLNQLMNNTEFIESMDQDEPKYQSELQNLLTTFSCDTENPRHNFNVGLWYEGEGHTAPALTYFLRAAERSTDDVFTYESLIKCHHCYDRQGTRDGTAVSLLQQALCLMPKRPEAYFLLARFHERRNQWHDCYKYASLGLSISDFNSKPLTSDVEYPGYYGLLFEKAVSGWWWGKVDESKEIFLDLANNYDMAENYYESVVNNLKHYNIDFSKEKKN